jgi:hypothetical protein
MLRKYRLHSVDGKSFPLSFTPVTKSATYSFHLTRGYLPMGMHKLLSRKFLIFTASASETWLGGDLALPKKQTLRGFVYVKINDKMLHNVLHYRRLQI